MTVVQPTPQGIATAAEAIRAGHMVVYPTETVYGIAVDPFSDSAVARLFQVKERDRNKPVLLIVANEEHLRRVVASISPAAHALMTAFWPGPLSLLFPRSPRVPSSITAGAEKICVRCPASTIARDLCFAVGSAITSSSANLSGAPPATSLAGFGLPGVEWGIDGGELAPSLPSAIVDPDTGAVIREGAISGESIMEVINSMKDGG